MSSDQSLSGPSNFVWYELHTFDATAATAFYGEVVGWGTQDSGMPGQTYSLITVGTIPVGGVLEKPAAAFADGGKPGWMGYIGVRDLDAFVGRLVKAGGKVHRAAQDIPGVGRFSVVADPQGAIFVLFEPNRERPAEVPTVGSPGTFAWHDLAAVDWKPEFEFYSSLFGWSKGDAIDMGSSGTYQIFAAGDAPIGGMMTRMDKSQAPGWFFYVNVEDIEAAIARAVSVGGKITHGPSTVPGGRRIAHCLDPQGAMFGMVAPE